MAHRPAQRQAVGTPARQLLLTVWLPRPGEFEARVLLADGRMLAFDSPFELLRFLSAPPPRPAPPARRRRPGLR